MSKPINVEQALNSLIKGINAQISNHAPLFEEAINQGVDEYNAVLDELDSRDTRIDRLEETKASLIGERDALVATVQQGNSHRAKVIAGAEEVQKLSRTVHSENNRLNAELKELRALNPKKMKEQIKRLKESNKSRDSEIKRLKNEVNVAAKQYSDLHVKHNTNIDTMKRMYEMMQLEGANCEKQFSDSDDNWFYVYRKPIVDNMSFSSTTEDDEIDNRDFYFEIQTNKGVSFHVMLLKSGDVGYPDVNLVVPDEVQEYCKEQYIIGDAPDEMIHSKTGKQDELDALLQELKNL